MKIYASKIDDIRKARDEWDAETERREAIRDESDRRYRKAQDEITAPVEYKIDTELKKFDILDFEVDVRPSSHYRGGKGLSVKVRCNERRVHDENSALSWNWEVGITEDGEIVKDSGSWSGLNATNEENMKSLRQSVEALEYLNSISWPELLDVETPSYSDYFTRPEERGKRPNFEQQLKEAEIEEFVGANVALRGRGIESLGYNERSKNIWYIIRRETPKKYVVATFTDYDIRNFKLDSTDSAAIIDAFKDRWPSQIKKEYLLAALEYPFVTLGK